MHVFNCVQSSPEDKKMETRPLVWCYSANVDHLGCVRIQTIAGGDVDGTFLVLDDSAGTLDLTSSPDWMEYIERTEHRLEDEGGAGAYDTIRCDLPLGASGHNDHEQREMNDGKWKVWGRDFHLKRIRQSYWNQFCSTKDGLDQQPNERLDHADEQTQFVMKALLDKVASSKFLNTIDETSHNDELCVQPVRLTFLWSPPKTNPNDNIIVRGHIVNSGPPVNIYRLPSPIVVSVAVVGESSLPTRFQAPQNKVASWCRLRKQLADKPPGVYEVIMVKADHDQLHVLEGTSSNVFVICENGTIRTAQEGVLLGYVRQLVLDVAADAGLSFDPQPICLRDASKGLWSEAFITSSSRLIFPISRILMPTDNESGHHFSTIWEDPYFQGAKHADHAPKWQQLLSLILIRGGGYAPKKLTIST
jgi:hypothetical protein